MKPCHESNGAAIYVGTATTVHNPLFQSQAAQARVARERVTIDLWEQAVLGYRQPLRI